VSFTRYLPHLVRSLVLVAGGGLIRRYHVGWQSWVLYNSGLLPETLVRHLVRRRIRPHEQPPQHGEAGATDIVAAEGSQVAAQDDSDANGGPAFDGASISRYRPEVTVSAVVRWQVDHHDGFIMAFLSTIRNAPIYAPQQSWKVLSRILRAKRSSPAQGPGLTSGKVLLVLGEQDSVIVKDETMEDARRVLGADGVEFAVLPGGHELPITESSRVAEAIEGFWHQTLASA
jgi:pimeloyl-ACP methyl ester carboxylesterase